MSERFSWTEPRLCTYNDNLDKGWFIYFDYTDHFTGHTIRKQFRGGINSFKTKDERLLHANALLTYWKKELKNGWNPFEANGDLPITKPIVTEAFDLILSLKQSSCGQRTMESYRHVLKIFKTWLIETKLNNIFLYQFDHSHARAFMDYLTLKKGYTGRTYNDKLVALSTFCNCMVDREWIVKNPFKKIKKLPITIGRNVAFTDEEKTLLKNYLFQHDRDMYYFTQFIYYCFIRRSELTRLKIENIDWKNMSIVIPSKASKNKKQESVVIPNSFICILKEMNLQNLPGDYFIFGRKLKPGPIQYKNYNHISSRHNEICKDLKLDSEKGLYSWKHSGVCALYPVLNGDVYALMRQLRHSELTTTQIYLKSLGLADNSAIRNADW